MILQRILLTSAFCLAMFSVQSAHGQASLTQFDLEGQAGSGLRFDNVVGGSLSSGTGGEVNQGIQYNSTTKELSIDIEWGSSNGFSDLAGSVSSLGLFGPADFTSSGARTRGLSGFNASSTEGGFSGTIVLSDVEADALLDGELYIRASDRSDVGLIRGNMVVSVPEPACAALLGFLSLGMLRRRRVS